MGCARALRLVVLSALGPRAHAERLCNLQDILAAMPPGSQALERYATAVYGAAPSTRAALLDWFAPYLRDEVEIVYKEHLPQNLLDACRWMREPTAIGDVHTFVGGWLTPGALWVHRLPGRVPCNAPTVQHPLVLPTAIINSTMKRALADDVLVRAAPGWFRSKALNLTFLARSRTAESGAGPPSTVFVEVVHRQTGYCQEDQVF
ncbi:hypothetical protein KFE25_012054 [Diacronema lutheri]|uniref:Uncharacterized protein n=1 Tax=Diacronema lutheri TaxID=2081491 RepID=A0A8J6C6U7_DIALT|nr:hypothetical protein KFE25_012054 [Diacronema lutheri]